MEGIILDRMCKYFGQDVKRINHALKVFGFCTAIAGGEKLEGKKAGILKTAAILHDIGIKEAEHMHGSSAAKYQEMEGPPVAKALLEGLHLPEEELERILFLIGNHHSYAKIDGLDFQILVEGDFLVNAFEDEIKEEALIHFKNNYFRTKTGCALLCALYLK